ncbi:MAG: L-aspartate oxidase [Acidobacteria bacterium]|nr:L-aspartate oxidase [Acidobacteriota bacterium]
MRPPTETLTTDYLVIGAGVAGLRAAISLAEAGQVLVLAKDSIRESSSQYAQGGIAVALSDDDQVELHEQDTLAAGDGLCNPEAVHVLVEEGPGAIQQLIQWGTEFDREGTKLVFAREGAHSRSRVLHAHGDSTGREMVRSLYKHAASLANVRFESFAAVTDLLMEDGEVVGAMAFDSERDMLVSIRARAVLLATGGLGRVFLETTNPDVATGDGVAIAYRAGATISDIEFVQFHPTALHLEGAPRFLLSEALRGEGAYLRNASGERFMIEQHKMAELAPRDVVSRCIVQELAASGEPHVFLDLTHLTGIAERFPRIYETCLHYGIDLAKQAAPVHPAAHYAMGGVRTDLSGVTGTPRLFAAGEVACTGVHGANRLASNSLLEGIVFGARAAEAMKVSSGRPVFVDPQPAGNGFVRTDERTIRTAAWLYAGLVRTAAGMETLLRQYPEDAFCAIASPVRTDYEVRNIVTVATLIARCGLARKESRGGHYRSDYPERSVEFQKHSVVKLGSAVSFEDCLPLPLLFLHAPVNLVASKMEYFRRLSTEELTASLRPGNAGELKVRIDGTILDGHHRIAVLRERGEIVDRLPRTIIKRSE